MSLVSNFTKVWAAKKLFTLMTKKITDLPAYKLGIIDADGKQLLKTRDMSPAQKRCFGPFERVSMYVRRVLLRHGVSAVALAMSYLEEKKFDEFVHYAESELDPTERDDFWRVIALLENLDQDDVEDDPDDPETDILDLDDDELDAIFGEETPTNVSGGVAGRDKPLKKGKDECSALLMRSQS